MTDELDLDAIEALSDIERLREVPALVAELRTARAERDEAKNIAEFADERARVATLGCDVLREDNSALAARIEAALAICDELEGEIDLAYAVRAALSGATEPAAGSD